MIRLILVDSTRRGKVGFKAEQWMRLMEAYARCPVENSASLVSHHMLLPSAANAKVRRDQSSCAPAEMRAGLQSRQLWMGRTIPSCWSSLSFGETTDYRPSSILDRKSTSKPRQVSSHDGAEYQSSNIPLPNLSKPLRPFFIHPSTSQSPHIPSDTEYIPIICLSASRWIGITGQQDEVPSVTRVGSRNVGFEYVPGAGDDDELWAKVGIVSLAKDTADVRD
jgi:hypothetical protein